MSRQDYVNYPHALLDVELVPSRSPHQHHARHQNHARPGWGTIIGFALSFTVILSVTLGGLGMPSPTNLPTQTSARH
jgi:hypothetical protein